MLEIMMFRRMSMRFTPLPCSLISITVALAGAPVPGLAAELLQQFGDWSFYSHAGEPKKICFATSRPTETLPKGANRAPIHFYVSAWPDDGVKTEISVKLGYPVRKNSDVTVIIGDDRFKLFGADDKAFVADPTQELKLIEAMKKGSKMDIQATSERGTSTVDTYSLSGISQVLQALATKCP